MVHRLRFIAVTVLSVLVLMIVGATVLSPAYATCPFTAVLSSSTITQGTPSITVTGTDGCESPPAAGALNVFLDAGTCGSGGSTVFSSATLTDVSSDFSQNIPTSSLSPGSYCVVSIACAVFPIPIPCIDTGHAISISDPLTVTSVIPEYPLGLAVLAIFMIIAYGIIRRKTRYDYA